MSLERKTPLRAKKGLDRGTKGLKRTGFKTKTGVPGSRRRLSARSEKTTAVYDGPRGDLNAWLAARVVPCERPGCRRRASCWHELRKRSAGGSMLNPANLKALCGECNGWVEDHPDDGRAAGMVVLEDDPRWEQLGARWWRLHMQASPDMSVTAKEVYVGQAVADGDHDRRRAPLLRLVGLDGKVVDVVLTDTLAYMLSAQLVSPATGLVPLEEHLRRDHHAIVTDACDTEGMAKLHLQLHPAATLRT